VRSGRVSRAARRCPMPIPSATACTRSTARPSSCVWPASPPCRRPISPGRSATSPASACGRALHCSCRAARRIARKSVGRRRIMARWRCIWPGAGCSPSFSAARARATWRQPAPRPVPKLATSPARRASARWLASARPRLSPSATRPGRCIWSSPRAARRSCSIPPPPTRRSPSRAAKASRCCAGTISPRSPSPRLKRRWAWAKSGSRLTFCRKREVRTAHMPPSDEARSSPVAVTLPDGSVRQFPGPVTGGEIAAAIGPGLAKAAVAIKVDGEARDLSRRVDRDARIAILTRDSPEALEIIRHDAAHVLAEAVKELYPETQVTFGPATETGFYYDFARPTPFTPEDLARIELRMHEIVDRNEGVTREEWERDRAAEFFAEQGEQYKAEWIHEIPKDEAISLYRQGKFVDLCVGPHLPSTGKLGHAFKLMKVAGAYWRGDARNAQLQRVYGTAWANEKELKQYLFQLEEAEKRDHRRLGRELDLFHQQEEAVGSVFWHPKGWTLWRTIENYLRARLEKGGYVEVKTPQLLDRALWEASGHWEKFRENMFSAESQDERVLALKPMNCPGHVQIFRQGLKSYRELPLRLAEFGSCHRNEPSGALHGVMRVRAFTQDDAHIFCTEEQVTAETVAFCELLK